MSLCVCVCLFVSKTHTLSLSKNGVFSQLITSSSSGLAPDDDTKWLIGLFENDASAPVSIGSSLSLPQLEHPE